MRALRALTGATQASLARAAGTSQPTIAAYESGRKAPTLRTLARLAASSGLELVVDFVPPLTREERRSLHLHAAIAAKLAEDPSVVLAQARHVLELMLETHPEAASLLREWELLLDLPVPHLRSLLTDPRPHARELRQVTPFAGVLTARERAAVYRKFADDNREPLR